MPEIHLTFEAIAAFVALVAILLPAAYFVGRFSARLGSLERWKGRHEDEHNRLWRAIEEIRETANQILGQLRGETEPRRK